MCRAASGLPARHALRTRFRPNHRNQLPTEIHGVTQLEAHSLEPTGRVGMRWQGGCGLSDCLTPPCTDRWTWRLFGFLGKLHFDSTGHVAHDVLKVLSCDLLCAVKGGTIKVLQVQAVRSHNNLHTAISNVKLRRQLLKGLLVALGRAGYVPRLQAWIRRPFKPHFVHRRIPRVNFRGRIGFDCFDVTFMSSYTVVFVKPLALRTMTPKFSVRSVSTASIYSMAVWPGMEPGPGRRYFQRSNSSLIGLGVIPTR